MKGGGDQGSLVLEESGGGPLQGPPEILDRKGRDSGSDLLLQVRSHFWPTRINKENYPPYIPLYLPPT
jgi:hypothetical protein